MPTGFLHPRSTTLAEIARMVQGKIQGNAEIAITGLSSIRLAEEGSLVFAEDGRRLKDAEASRASAVLVRPDTQSSVKTLIHVSEPKLAFTRLMEVYFPPTRVATGIHPSAVIDPSARLGREVGIGPHVTIGAQAVIADHAQIGSNSAIMDRCQLGEYSVIHPSVTLYPDTRIGRKVTVHSGTVIGSDGFGYVQDGDKPLKVPQVGNVIIEDEVEIGANVTIDRATFGSTHIKRGAKIDNLVQIAHNDEIGEFTIITAQTGISGSTVIGDRVIIAGQVGISDHVTIGSGAIVGPGAGIPTGKRIPPKAIYLGAPARPIEEAKKAMAAMNRLPELMDKFQNIEQEVERLSARLGELEKAPIK